MEGIRTASWFVRVLYDVRISKAELQERQVLQVVIRCNVEMLTSLVASHVPPDVETSSRPFLNPCPNIAFVFICRHRAIIANLPLVSGMAQSKPPPGSYCHLV